MFNNVGKTIKILAKVFLWGGIALSIITWLTCFIIGVVEENVVLIITAFFALIFGIIGSWISSIYIYGFGIIVETNETITKTNIKVANNTTLTLEDSDDFGSFH